MKPTSVQVPAKLFLELARVYKQAKRVEDLSTEERAFWIETNQIERRAQAKAKS